jgi:FKBP-type peptidyl-prolyl cis-trans isomerase SlyD
MKTIQLGSTVVVKTVITSAGDNEVLSGDDDVLEFTCGKHQIFEGVESAVMGLSVGEIAYVQLEPEEHVGDYDTEFLRVELREHFPDNIEEGMLFEGLPSERDAQELAHDPEHAQRIYLVTDVTDEAVVLDGNHPLAGMALRFQLTVVSIDDAAPEGVEYVEDVAGVDEVDDIAETDETAADAADFAPNFKAIGRT